MSKEDSIEVEGVVQDAFPASLFNVNIGEKNILCTLSGKLRINKIRILVGDKVTCEMSPYDLSKGRITFRHK